MVGLRFQCIIRLALSPTEEYLVIYQRLHGGEEAPSLSREAPFLLELPLYWRNAAGLQWS